MAAQFCAFDTSADAALLAYHSGGTTEAFVTQLPVTVTWATFGTSTLAAGTQPTDPVGVTAAVDTLSTTWLVIATTAGGLYLVKEQSATSITTVLSGAGISDDWQAWGRIVAGRVESYFQ